MKKLFICLLLCLSTTADSTVWRAPNGILYGDICQTPYGWQQVPALPVGTNCFAPQFRAWGYIANA